MKKIILFIILLTLITVFCEAQRSTIQGKIFLNPSDTSLSATSQIVEYSGIPLEIFVYPLRSKAEVDIEEGFITRIYGPVIQRTLSSWDGSFKVKVPPGSYSVFVLFKSRYFGNLQDKEGNLSPVRAVKKGKHWITITMDYSGYH